MNDVMQAPRGGSDEATRKVQPLFPKVAGAEQDAEGIDLREILAVLRRRFAVIAGCAIVLMALATVKIYQLTPRYTAQATLMLEQQ